MCRLTDIKIAWINPCVDDPRMCVSKEIKNTNAKVFNLMLGVNEARFLVKHESCEGKCRLN